MSEGSTVANRLPQRRLEPHEVRTLASKASVYPTTARKWLRGEPVRGMCRERLERAAGILGMLDGVAP